MEGREIQHFQRVATSTLVRLWESHLRRCPHPQGAVQIKAVMEMSTPSSKKELQLLIDKLVALGSFIARFIDKLRPFFLVLRKASAIGWTDNCQNAFEEIKHYITQPPILSSP
ncbi:hypothetical protein CK203_084847 [Vitis vinifera]|uniref:Reverse transcriptase/retrotransposon-derived protein RNase H-like domain-containing protein n=1 Tax=Vitis vinifera TaxID=29760 RepID=A0A438BVS6_VITVI|nr:hypothetical protein CK203_084847 [Vitis vinifera]